MRKPGEGRIYKAPGRSVWMVAFYGPKKNGQWGEIRASASTESEERAREYLKEQLEQVAAYRKGLQKTFEGPKQRRVKLSELLDYLLAEYRRQGKKDLPTVAYRIGPDSRLRREFGDRRVGSLTEEHFLAYQDTLSANGLANATINRELDLVRLAVAIALAKGKIARPPVMPTRLPEENTRRGFFERADLEALLPRLPEPLGDMVRFAFTTGWRRGELLGLTWESVSKDEIRLYDSKNGEGRVLPLDGELAEIIERRRAARDYVTPTGPGISGFVFHRNGEPINRTTFGKQWRRACVAAGLGRRDEKGHYEGKLFHDLRRSAARNMIRSGTPQAVAKTITGHKTDAMFTRYNITDDRDKSKALEAVRAYVEREASTSNVVKFSKATKD